MLELLISMMITLGIQFTALDNGQISISADDAMRLEASGLSLESTPDVSIYDVVITSGIDPSALSSSSK